MYLYIKEEETHQLINLIKFETISKKDIGDGKYALALYKETDKNGSPSIIVGCYSEKGMEKVLDEVAESIGGGKRMYELEWYD